MEPWLTDRDRPVGAGLGSADWDTEGWEGKKKAEASRPAGLVRFLRRRRVISTVCTYVLVRPWDGV